MAGDWIKMRSNLWSDPRVSRLCDILDKPKATIIGGLYWLWANADQHSVDGTMPGLTMKGLDRETGIRGFAKALTDPAVKWLEDGPDGVSLPRFTEHNGESAKSRAEGQKRKANWRKKSGQMSHEERDKRPANDGTPVPQPVGQIRDKSEAREEKRREVLITTPATGTTVAPVQPVAGAVPPDGEGPRHIAEDLSLDALRTTPPAGSLEHERAAELWAALHANGCKGTASHPAVIEMARRGVTVEALKRAIVEARKTRDGPLNPAYLAAIIDRQAGEKPANGKAAAWATDERACELKARELGLWPARAGEGWDVLRGRIRAKLAADAEERVR